MNYTRVKKIIKSKSAKSVNRSFSRFSILAFLPVLLNFIVLPACNLPDAAAEKSSAESSTNEPQNRAALQKAQVNIEQFRKGDAQIRVVGKNGKPLKNAKLNIKQLSHDFKFGGYLKIDDLAADKLPDYEKRFAKLFNFAVVGTYWDFVENKAGAENWQWFEREIALAQKLNLRIEAAPIIWGTNQAGTPKWLPREKDELTQLVRQHVKSIVAKYGNVVEDWEIVNEPLAPKTDVFAERVGRDYIAEAFAEARKTNPTKRLMINEYGVFGSVKKHNYNQEKYFDLVKTLIEKEAPIDVIGIQAHANGEWYAPADVAEKLERYAALGKPLQITEFSAQTLDYHNRQKFLSIAGNYRNGVWDNEKQAEFYREFYTIAFGNPQVEAIVQWGVDDERAWLPGIGLIDETGNPKPNYEMLDRLINNEWKTNLQANISSEETYKFRGFYGVYEIEIVNDGKVLKTEFELKKIGQNLWIARV